MALILKMLKIYIFVHQSWALVLAWLMMAIHHGSMPFWVLVVANCSTLQWYIYSNLTLSLSISKYAELALIGTLRSICHFHLSVKKKKKTEEKSTCINLCFRDKVPGKLHAYYVHTWMHLHANMSGLWCVACFSLCM